MSENKLVYKIGYHTQEDRGCFLSEPKKCVRDDAWLGYGYYFWYDEDFAHIWGKHGKNGKYHIYSAELDVNNCIDTVFSEEGYNFFIKAIEDAKQWAKDNKRDVTVENIHGYLSTNLWSKLSISGIVFEDLPVVPKLSGILISINKNIDKASSYVYYRKRIQVVLFGLNEIKKFKFHCKSETNTYGAM